MDWLSSLEITWETLMKAIGIIAVMIGGVEAILKLFGPFRRLKARLDAVEERIERHDGLLQKDHESIMELRDTDKMLSRSALSLIDQAMAGNPPEELQKIREAHRAHYINR